MNQEGSVSQSTIDQLVDAAMTVAAGTGWARLDVASVARAADLRLSDIPPHVLTALDLLEHYSHRIDAAMARAAGELTPNEPARDRLFETMMARFDAMTGERQALEQAAREARRDPFIGAQMSRLLTRTASRTLEAAGFSSTGVRGAARTAAVLRLHVRTAKVWFGDGDDQARTMARLDEGVRKLFAGRRGRLLGFQEEA
jgi:hypothetical protein